MVDYEDKNLVNDSNEKDIDFEVDIPYKSYFWNVSYKLKGDTEEDWRDPDDIRVKIEVKFTSKNEIRVPKITRIGIKLVKSKKEDMLFSIEARNLHIKYAI